MPWAAKRQRDSQIFVTILGQLEMYIILLSTHSHHIFAGFQF